MLHRRELLAGISTTGMALTAGCLGNTSPTNGDDGDGNPEDFNREIAVTAYDETPEEVPVAISMEVTEASITPDGTARFRKELENTGEEELVFQRLFDKGWSKDESDPGILVYATDAGDAPTTAEAVHCVPGADPDAGRDASDMANGGPPGHSLDPGETDEVEYLVADDWDFDTCFPPGEYRFQNDDVAMEVEGDNSVEFSWRFSIEVSE